MHHLEDIAKCRPTLTLAPALRSEVSNRTPKSLDSSVRNQCHAPSVFLLLLAGCGDTTAYLDDFL